MLFINKLDRERADFATALKSIKDILEVQAVPLQLPIGKEAGFKGVVDLISQKAYTGAGGKLEAGPIPDDLQDEVAELRGDLMNFAAESDDALIEKFLEEGELTPEEIYRGLKIGVLKGAFVPVLCGTSANHAGPIGTSLLLDAIHAYLPAPEDKGAVQGSQTRLAAKKWPWNPTRTAPWRPRSSRPWPTPTPAASPSSGSIPAP